jgi:hypothetical protein
MLIWVDLFRLCSGCSAPFRWMEWGLCSCKCSGTQVCMRVKQSFSERMSIVPDSLQWGVYIYPPALAEGPWWHYNGRQVAVGKRMESHDEQLMPIILVVGHYNLLEDCDRWPEGDLRGSFPYWALLDGPREVFPQLLGSWALSRTNWILLVSSTPVGSNSSKVNNVRVFININHESKVDIDVQE